MSTTAIKELAVLEEVTNLRSVWDNEAVEFTPWLAKNLKLLGDALKLTFDEGTAIRESAVGDFYADIVVDVVGDGQKRIAVVENQLEETNHDHLGKLLTYAAGFDASIIIWVVDSARPEHRAAIEWLNSNTQSGIDFYLAELHLYKIGSSAPAVKFEVVEIPNDWAKESKQRNREYRAKRRLKFYQGLIDFVSKDEFGRKLFNGVGATSFTRLAIPFEGVNGAFLTIWLDDPKSIWVGIFFEPNAFYYYKKLHEEEAAFKAKTSRDLQWTDLDNGTKGRIWLQDNGRSYYNDESLWGGHFKWILETLRCEYETFADKLKEFQIDYDKKHEATPTE